MRMNPRRVAKRFVSNLRKFTHLLGRPLDRDVIAATYLRGTGLEIGALHNPLPAPKSAQVRYVDRLSVNNLRNQYPELASEPLVDVDIVDDGETLAAIPDASQDFIIANHFLEHCQNPIRALSNHFRVLKPDGILYLALPDKRYSFDCDRPSTTFEHLWRDFQEGPEWSRRQHVEEYVRLVQKVRAPAEIEKGVARLLETDYSIHYHVWSEIEMIEFLASVRQRLTLDFEFELIFKNRLEIIFILRKPDPPA
jgi:predicted SAM-dependent methyltransferase